VTRGQAKERSRSVHTLLEQIHSEGSAAAHASKCVFLNERRALCSALPEKTVWLRNKISTSLPTSLLTSLPYFTSLFKLPYFTSLLTSLPRYFTPMREPRCAPAAADADSALQVQVMLPPGVSMQITIASVSALPPAPFRPCEFPAETLEMKSLIVQQRHREFPMTMLAISQTVSRNHLLARSTSVPASWPRHLYRHLRREVENHAPLDDSLDGEQRRNTLAAIRLFVHFPVHIFVRRLQRLREDRIRGIDERLNQFHLMSVFSCKRHRRANGVGIVAEHVPRISYSTSGFTGFLYKCFRALLEGRQMFSWYPTKKP